MQNPCLGKLNVVSMLEKIGVIFLYMKNEHAVYNVQVANTEL
jgi:hypothetical protein